MRATASEISVPGNATISLGDFVRFQKIIFDLAGINLADAIKEIPVGRLSKRLKHSGFSELSGFDRHYRNATDARNTDEPQTMVDLLTTNETYFFREPKHFDFLRELAPKHRGSSLFRVWSAAASSGEEAYRIAMVLADALGATPWKIVGTNFSVQVLFKARTGLYPLERAEDIPLHLLQKYCLKGRGDHEGSLLITSELRSKLSFLHCNLLSPDTRIGQFDVIFPRNVMIYFDTATERKVVDNLLPFLKRGGYFIVGYSESLNGLSESQTSIRPTIYRRVES